ncbi:phage tail assembly chaperone [Gehongia tenuis]|uniref:XkdN-like protein n=1 Tax=Gehongia tenuis TaxID=2763655 RepID=A0A926D305_9FIRM|nr:hypothetical protein [Gehongia tenuis]MBC8530572.1 XkdN-like protein [Gehongia tenuis]
MDLREFLQRHPVDDIREKVVVGERLRDEAGNPLAFEIRALTADAFEKVRRASERPGPNGPVLDARRFTEYLVIEGVAAPSFRDAEAMAELSCSTPEQYLAKTLLAGEILKLSAAIQRLSGFDTSLDEDIQTAKN